MSLEDRLSQRLRGRHVAFVAVLIAAAATGCLSYPAAAAADSFGQLNAWVASPNQVDGIGVDPTDNSVFVLDRETAELSSPARLRKFTAQGALIASVSIPRPEQPALANVRPNFTGVAVDPILHRAYVLQNSVGLDSTQPSEDVAQQILAFSTEPNGAQLHAPSSAALPFDTISLPDPTGPMLIRAPWGFAVDPGNGDLLINGAQTGGFVLQRIAANGTVGARRSLELSGDSSIVAAAGLAVAQDGTTYVAARNNVENTITRAVSLPRDMSSETNVLTKVAVDSPFRWSAIENLGEFSLSAGPLIALSQDGRTLYRLEWSSSNSSLFVLRGKAIATGAPTAAYGGGTTECALTGLMLGVGTSSERRVDGLATGSGGTVFVLDKITGKVIEFGPGGTGCPGPQPSFTANGSGEATVTVQKGDSVTFNASGSEFKTYAGTGTGTEAVWTASGPEAATKTFTAAASLTPWTRRLLKAGTYTVGVNMKLKPNDWGKVGAVKTLLVKPATPIAAFTPSTSSPASGTTVSFDAGASSDPTGGACSEASGCTSTNVLKTYHWDFGDGQTQDTTSPTTTHEFVNPGGTSLDRQVSLTVTSNDEAVSAPVGHTITVGAGVTPKSKLTVVKQGAGSGTVGSLPSGINCGSDCEEEYDQGTAVALTGTPTPGTHTKAVVWGGCDSIVGSNECRVEMTALKNVTASFDQITHTLAVVKPGSGTGSVECKLGAGSFGSCAASYLEGAEVFLQAIPSSGSEFKRWEGCDSIVGSNECKVTLSSDKSVSAVIDLEPNHHTLTVNKAGTGAVECKLGAGAFGTCAASYDEGDVITLKATPGQHFSFAGWSELTGSGSVTTACTAAVAECEVKLDNNVSLKATFSQITHTLTVNKAGTGTGAVTCNGGACATAYPEGTLVTLAAVPAAGSTFSGWSGGGCSGTAACTVTLGANATVTASFEAPPTGGGGSQGGSSGSGSGTVPPPSGGGPTGKTPAQKRQEALAKCKKLHGKAKGKCIKKAKQIGKPKKGSRVLERLLPFPF